MGKKANFFHEPCPKFNKGEMKHALVETSTFTEKYPRYLQKLITEQYEIMKKILADYDIKINMKPQSEELSVSTTDKTWDPWAIMMARDFIRLICRSMPLEKASKVFEENITHEIIKIKGLVRDEAVFKKRRAYLMGQNDTTLDMLERILDVNVKVQGGTVAIVGPRQGVLMAFKFVNEVMKGSHPLHLLKQLQVYDSCSKDEAFKDKDWSSLIPQFKSKSENKNKKKKEFKKKKDEPYNPLPPPIPKTKEELELEEGKLAFSDKDFRKGYKLEGKIKSQEKQAAKRARKYEAPEEPPLKKAKTEEKSEVDPKKLKKKLKALENK